MGGEGKMKYAEFLHRKKQREDLYGFEPTWIPDWMFPFQRDLVQWAIRKGRAAIFADCGLGKTPMQLVWAENVHRQSGKPVIILTPLAVSHQCEREARKFGIDAARSEDGSIKSPIVIANYERLHHFDQSRFAGMVCDESSILKNFAGKRRSEITEFARQLPYRLLCTATAAPNDFWELGTSSEALGYLGHTDMITRFFKEETSKDYLGWGRKTYCFRGHAEIPFWQWVCSWARACRKPSDMGYDDDGFILPELIEREMEVQDATPRDGFLFSIPAADIREQREERKVTMDQRCELAAANAANHAGATVLWCHYDKEGDTLERMIPGSLQVSGKMTDEKKEERLLAFQSGEAKVLITKPKIGCFGLNWQHCHNVVTFPSHSWEQYYQAVRRCYRFGQKNPVTVSIITTPGENRVLQNLQRKAGQANQMFESLVNHMHHAQHIGNTWKFEKAAQLPSWITSH